MLSIVFVFFKQKTAYEMRISDWSSDVCSSDLRPGDRDGTWDVTPDIRFRATRSRDIRAPALAELFGGSTTAQFTVLDPLLGRSYSVQSLTSGRSEERSVGKEYVSTCRSRW